MRPLDWSGLVLGLVLALTGACGQPSQDETPNPTLTAKVILKVSATITVATTVATTATATSTPQPTERPSPANTVSQSPTQTSRPTATPELARPLPDGWQQYGDERFGLQLAAPQTWAELTALLRAFGAIDRFGPHMLLLADSVETGERLIAGAPFDQGAYVLGFTTDTAPTVTSPEESLAELLASLETEFDAPLEPVAVTINNVPGAYVDLPRDPINAFPPLTQPLRFRLLSLIKPGTRTSTTFLMGAAASSWDEYGDTFSKMQESILLPDTNANVNGHMISGDRVEGSLEKEVVDVWTFNGERGRYATITLTPDDSSMDLTLTLFDPTGNVLVSMDNGYAGDQEVLTDVLLPASGTYIIEAEEFFNEAALYELSLLISAEPQFGGGGRLNFGQQITSELVENGEHTWVFDGTVGQSVTIILTSLNEQLDVILELHGPDGRQLVLLDEGFAGDAEVLTDFELSITGEYVILLRGFAGHGGMYSLSLDEGGESTANFYDAGDLVDGDSQRELLREDEAHAWFFDGSAGNDVTIEVTPLESNMDMDIWLLDPDLKEAAAKDEFLSGEAETIEFTLPVDGQYLVLVREFFGESGEYEITLNISGDNLVELAGTLTYSQTVSGELAIGKRVAWQFSGQADDVIDIILTPTEPERDLVIVLVDPEGNTAITIDAALSDLSERLIDFTLTADGEWLIVIQEFFNEGSGYELTLNKQE